MLRNFRLPISLNASCDIPFESTVSVVKKEQSDKHIEYEKKMSFEKNTDYQSFLLPLEQDFTKSSKGYASVLASIPDKDMNDIDYENKLKGSSMLLREHFPEADYIRNVSDKNVCDNSSVIHDFNGDANNLYHEKNTKFNDALNIVENDHRYTEITLDASCKKNHVLKNQENMFSKKCLKITHNYPVILLNSSRINNKSNDENSSETNSSCGCKNTLNFDDDSNIHDSISSDKIIKKKNQYSTTNIKQTFHTDIHSDNSESSDADDDDDYFKQTEESTNVFISEDCNFESDSNNLLNNPIVSQRDLYDPVITFSCEGYVNTGFEDDDFLFEESSVLKSINESWNDSMKNISNEPHESRRVSFVPLPDLVSVHSYEPDDDNYCYSLYVLDQLRFQNRIQDFDLIIAPYLTPEHRENIYQRNCLLNCCDHLN